MLKSPPTMVKVSAPRSESWLLASISTPDDAIDVVFAMEAQESVAFAAAAVPLEVQLQRACAALPLHGANCTAKSTTYDESHRTRSFSKLMPQDDIAGVRAGVAALPVSVELADVRDVPPWRGGG